MLLLLAGEGVCRLFDWHDILLYRPHPRLLWEWIPDQDATERVEGFPVRINTSGFRGPEFSRLKPPDTVRIVAAGGSCTFGAQIELKNTFPEQLRENLLREDPPMNLEVINAGVNGYSIFQVLIVLTEKILPLKPDLVIVAYSFNDGWQFFDQDADEALKEEIRRGVETRNLLKRSALLNFLYWEIGTIRSALARGKYDLQDWDRKVELSPEIQEEIEEKYRQNLEGIIAACRDHGIELCFLMQTSREQLNGDDPLFKPTQDVFRRVAHENGIAIVETLEAFRSASGEKLFRDAVHPTVAGHRITGRLLADEIIRRGWYGAGPGIPPGVRNGGAPSGR